DRQAIGAGWCYCSCGPCRRGREGEGRVVVAVEVGPFARHLRVLRVVVTARDHANAVGVVGSGWKSALALGRRPGFGEGTAAAPRSQRCPGGRGRVGVVAGLAGEAPVAVIAGVVVDAE